MGEGEIILWEERSWSDAPEEILCLIRSNLRAVGDVVSFSAVCKTWRSVPRTMHKIFLSDEELCASPFLLVPDTRVFHPMYNMPFKMETLVPLPDYAKVVEQKHGWLLMVERHAFCSFVFNPFTGEKIDLPDNCRYALKWPTFSTQPTSPDCEIVEFYDTGNIMVQTIKLREPTFSNKDVCRGDSFPTLFRYKSTFFRGEFYCLGKEGNLVIYNPNKNKHRRTGFPTNLWRHFCAPDCGRHLFEGEDDLWSVFVACQGREMCVCKWNLNKMMWERVYDLEDRMMFIGFHNCMMDRSKVRGTGNKIYFPKLMNGNCLFYSLSTKKYHTFEGGVYESFHGSKELTRCTWIKMDNGTLPSPNGK